MLDGERFTPAAELPVDFYERTSQLVDAAEIVTKYTVFWLAGRSNDGRQVFVDKRVPVKIAKVDVRRTLAFHELGEWIRMNEGEKYDSSSTPPGRAHYDANGVEKLEVERQGGDWEEYCIALRPLLKEAEVDEEELSNPPPVEDWDLRPISEDDPEFVEELVGKSTFSAPTSATSGLQGYDLEGAVRRRKRNKSRRQADANEKANAMNQLNIFVPITKYDAKNRLAYGTIAAEVPDKVNEIMDYASSVPEFKLWSDEISKASDGKSVGNVRVMHQPVVGGKMTEIDYDDAHMKITGIAKVLTDETHRLIEEGALTGFSIGGGYVKRWKDPDNEKLTRYTARPAEVSFVDNPCIPGCTFEYVKMDGSVEKREFHAVSSDEIVDRVTKETTAPAAGNDDKAQPRGASAGPHEGRSGDDGDEGDTDTLLGDASNPRAGVKPVKPKDDGAAQNRHAKPKPDSVKEQSSAESTVPHHKTPTASDIANRAVELAKAAGKEDAGAWADYVAEARTELEKAAHTTAAAAGNNDQAQPKGSSSKPEGKDVRGKADAEADKEKRKEGVKESAGKADADDLADETQVWVHPKLPGKTFTRKADLRAALIQAEADAAAAKAAGPAQELLDQIASALTPEAEKMTGADALRKPWATNADLPKSVQGLPDEAKTVFREAANGQLKRSPGDDEAAMKVGWTAVKNGWKKEGDKWVKKDIPDDELPYWMIKREYSDAVRQRYAAEGIAMRDGSYPIPDKGALKDAIEAHGRAKNKGAAKRHIVRRAKALGATDLLPKEWHASTAKAEMGKAATFGTMQGLMGLLSYAEQFEEMLEREPDGWELMFDSGSTSIKVSKDICDRFGKLLGELGDIAADILDDLLNAMKDEERAEATGTAGKVATAIFALQKIGARNSGNDKDLIKSAHDIMVKLEPEVCPVGKTDPSAELSKAAADLEKVTAERDAFGKSMDGMAETLKDILGRVKKIENTPVGISPALGPNGERRYAVVEKSVDMGGLSASPGDGPGAEKMLDNPDVLKALADAAVRHAQRSPIVGSPGMNYGQKK